MRLPLSALLIGATLLAGPALASKHLYKVTSVTITGLKSLPKAELLAVIKEHKGSKVTTDDIIADQNAMAQVLKDNNVAGDIATSINSDGITADVIFTITDKGIQKAAPPPPPVVVAPKLHAEIFVGNVAMTSDELTAASGLTPGEDLSNDKIMAAEKAIAAAYQASKTGVAVQLGGQNTRRADGSYNVTWTIKETTPTAPAKKSDDSQKSDSSN